MVPSTIISSIGPTPADGSSSRDQFQAKRSPTLKEKAAVLAMRRVRLLEAAQLCSEVVSLPDRRDWHTCGVEPQESWVTRGCRSALWGTAAAVALPAVVTATAGYALGRKLV